MGFGTLFFGYFFTFAFSASNVYFFADILGCIIMLFAFTKLSQFNRYYVWATGAAMALTLISLASALTMLFKIPLAPSFGTALDAVKALSAWVTQIFIFLGIRGISMGAECTKLVKKAQGSLVMTSTYYIALFAVLFTGHLYPDAVSVVSLWVYAYWWVCFILNLVLIYQAFGLLYAPEDEEKEKKRSRFKLINYMNDKMDTFEENSNKYRKESMKMALEEAEKRRSERNAGANKQHSKKKKKK